MKRDNTIAPRRLAELAEALTKPMSHQQADAILIEALQSLVYQRILNPQQRDATLKVIRNYAATLTSEEQLALFGEEKEK